MFKAKPQRSNRKRKRNEPTAVPIGAEPEKEFFQSLSFILKVFKYGDDKNEKSSRCNQSRVDPGRRLLRSLLPAFDPQRPLPPSFLFLLVLFFGLFYFGKNLVLGLGEIVEGRKREDKDEGATEFTN